MRSASVFSVIVLIAFVIACANTGPSDEQVAHIQAAGRSVFGVEAPVIFWLYGPRGDYIESQYRDAVDRNAAELNRFLADISGRPGRFAVAGDMDQFVADVFTQGAKRADGVEVLVISGSQYEQEVLDAGRAVGLVTHFRRSR